MIKKIFPIAVIGGFASGLIGQFIWKAVYHPEPLIPMVIECSGIIILAIVASCLIYKEV